MKVLFVHVIPDAETGNPFVTTLADEMRRSGCEVDIGVSGFWNDENRYDIVHFHWPKEIFGNWRAIGEEELSAFKAKVSGLKAMGTKIFYTRHNSEQHYEPDALGLNRLYRMIEDMADGIVHMGDFSRREVVARAGDAIGRRDFVIPHHVYDAIPRAQSREMARRRFAIRDGECAVLSFGVFRAHEERTMVWDACRAFKTENIRLLAPRFFSRYFWKGSIVPTLREWAYRRTFKGVKAVLGGPRVPASDIPDFFTAADVVLIQRRHILNSGNVPMAFYFGKVAVGPDVGNVGEWLRATGNPVFDPDRPESVAAALEEGLRLAEGGLGKANRAYADSELSSALAAKRYLEAYVSV